MSYRGISSKFWEGAIAALLVVFLFAVSPVIASAAEVGTIAGKVTGAPGAVAVKGAEVCAGEIGKEAESKCTETATDGTYAISGLPVGQYKVQFNAAGTGRNLVQQYYQGASSPEAATPVTVSGGTTTNNIDAELQPGGRISGTVIAAATRLPVAEELVCAFATAGEECTRTASNGTYVIEGLVAGSYAIEFFDEEEEFEIQFYPGRSSESEAASVAVTVGSTAEHIDAALFRYATVSGHVYTAADRRPAPNDEVCVFRSSGALPYSCVQTNLAGAYLLEVPPGSYKVGFSIELSEYFPEFGPEPDGWPTQFWNLKPSLAQADVIALPREGVAAGIDGLLGYVPPAPPPAGPVVSPVVPVSGPKPIACRKHFHKLTKHGETRCVHVHRSQRHHRHQHHKSGSHHG